MADLPSRLKKGLRLLNYNEWTLSKSHRQCFSYLSMVHDAFDEEERVTSALRAKTHPITRQILGTSSSSDSKSVNVLKFLFIFISVYYILPRTLLTYYFRKLLLRRRRPLEFTESLLLYYNRTPRFTIPLSNIFHLLTYRTIRMDIQVLS